MINNKKTMMIGITLGLVLLMASFAIAAGGIGVARPYWEGYPLKMFPGEEATVNLNLQVTADAEDSFFIAEVIEDGEGIATFDQPDLKYEVKSGSNTDVPVTIKVPEDIEFGEVREIRVMFTQIIEEEEGGGMLQLAQGVEISFPVEIVIEGQNTFYGKEPATEGISTLIWRIAILLGLIVLYFIFRNLKKK